jgi:hypothetical protein
VQTAAAAPLPGPPVVAREQAPLVQPLPAPRAEEIDAPIREAGTPVVARRETPPPERSAVNAPDRGSPAAASTGDTARAETPAASAPANVAAVPERQPVATLPAGARPGPESPRAAPVAAVASKPEPTPPGPARVGQEDSVLASIVAGITIPGEELQIVNATPVDLAPEPVRPAPKPEPAKPTVKPEATKPVAKPKPEPAKPDPKAKKPDPAKLDPKAKKPDPKVKKAEPKTDPARIWVQVAGGANAASLPKAWKAVTAKAPAAFRGKAGWWTPLRATNRVLTGPFKTNAEAQAFVNSLGKSGVSGFVFSSEAGQKVTRLGGD